MRPLPIDPLAGALFAVAARVQYGAPIPSDTAQRLLDALAIADRDLAARELAKLLNLSGRRSRWDVAGEIAERMRVFESTGRPAQSGAIESRFERMLGAPSCPRTQRHIADLIY